MRAKMRAAERAGADVVVIVGEEELAQDAVTVRSLRSGTQTSAAATTLLEAVRPLVAGFDKNMGGAT